MTPRNMKIAMTCAGKVKMLAFPKKLMKEGILKALRK
jgi:hypothetical protein